MSAQERVKEAYLAVRTELSKIKEIRLQPSAEALKMYSLSNVLTKVYYALQREISNNEANDMVKYLENEGMQIAKTITSSSEVVLY